MNLQVPQNAGNFLTSWETVSFSRRLLPHGVSYDWFHIGITFSVWLLRAQSVLGYGAVSLNVQSPMFRKTELPSFSGTN
jgi:hypothetical protein